MTGPRTTLLGLAASVAMLAWAAREAIVCYRNPRSPWS